MRRSLAISLLLLFISISLTDRAAGSNFSQTSRSDRIVISFDLVTRDMDHIEEPEGVHSATVKHYGIRKFITVINKKLRSKGVKALCESKHSELQRYMQRQNEKIDRSTSDTVRKQAVQELNTRYKEALDALDSKFKEISDQLFNVLYENDYQDSDATRQECSDIQKELYELKRKKAYKKERRIIAFGRVRDAFSLAAGVLGGGIGAIKSGITAMVNSFKALKQGYGDVRENLEDLDINIEALRAARSEEKIAEWLGKTKTAKRKYLAALHRLEGVKLKKLEDSLEKLRLAIEKVKADLRQTGNIKRSDKLSGKIRTLERKLTQGEEKLSQLKDILKESQRHFTDITRFIKQRERELEEMRRSRTSRRGASMLDRLKKLYEKGAPFIDGAITIFDGQAESF